MVYKELPQSKLNASYLVNCTALTIVTQGHKEVQPAQGPAFRVGPGQMLLMPKDLYMVQDLVAPSGQAFKSWLFFFHEALVQSFLGQLQMVPGSAQPYTNDGLNTFEVQPPIAQYLDHLHVQLPAFKHPALVDIKLLELLHLLAMQPYGARLVQQLQHRTPGPRSLSTFMEAHYTKPLKVADFAHLTGRSLSSFLRDFKRHFNTTPHQWLVQKRMQKAQQLLQQESQSVTQAALAVGYENLSHFIKAFKERYGLSPKQYLLQQRQQSLA